MSSSAPTPPPEIPPQDKQPDSPTDPPPPAQDAAAMDTTPDQPPEETWDDIPPEILSLSTDEILTRTRLIENDIKVRAPSVQTELIPFMHLQVMKSETLRLQHEQSVMKEKIRDNGEKIKQNKVLPYLVGNVVEVILSRSVLTFSLSSLSPPDPRCRPRVRRGWCKSRLGLDAQREMCRSKDFHSTNRFPSTHWSRPARATQACRSCRCQQGFLSHTGQTSNRIRLSGKSNGGRRASHRNVHRYWWIGEADRRVSGSDRVADGASR